MRRAVLKRDLIKIEKETVRGEYSHSSDRAICIKHMFKGRGSQMHTTKKYTESELDKILRMRNTAEKFPEYRADGRMANYDYLGVKRFYDKDGVDEDGFYADGESATPGEFNRDGWKEVSFTIKGITRCRLEDREGYGDDGYDREGYDRSGFNHLGVNRSGFNREGIYIGTGKEYDKESFNAYDLDAEGRNREGRIDPDVALALELLNNKRLSYQELAERKEMSVAKLKRLLDKAKLKMPSMAEPLMIRNRHHVSQQFYVVKQDVEKLVSGEIDFDVFWVKHPKLSFLDLEEMLPSEIFADYLLKIAETEKEGDDMLHFLAMATKTNRVEDLMNNVQKIVHCVKRKEVETGDAKLQEMNKKIIKIYAELQKLNRMRRSDDLGLKSLRSGTTRIGRGGEIFTVTAEMVDEAIRRIKERSGIVICRTVRAEIFKMREEEREVKKTVE